ncbi:hypothetical protein B9Z55_017357 [Caenorhabditis nigoni]|uniref:Nuclear receptor domain-containing protein n=1 Tax=Caenorhabditis nigoni TaxID=1611254 RepID=A0A2G5T957_9PELO|nr:hypothetical protein B9Z55_017357 [Caenorhabditis nigoni]
MEEYEELPDLEVSTPSSSSSTSKVQLYKNLPKNQFPPICVVCRNPSAGYHFDVPSCNGCKSFFRRAIISGTRYKCNRRNDCFDTEFPIPSTRLTCRGCRFEACVNAGMNPTAIQYKTTEASRKLVEEILEQQNSNTSEQPSTSSPAPRAKLMFTDEAVSKLISKLSAVEKISSKIHNEGLPNGYFDDRALEEILTSSMVLENSRIPNLQRAKEEEIWPSPLLFTHCSFLSSVEYSKTFDFYLTISLQDKLKLARHVTVACANLHSAFFSINTLKSDCLRFPDGEQIGKPRHADLENKKPPVSLFESSFAAIFRNKLDRVEYMLLKAIVMCNPAVCSLSAHAQCLLSNERNKFGFSLLQYCRLQHGALHGPSRYAELLSIIPIVENNVKILKDFHTYVNVVLVQSGHKFFFTKLFNEALRS